VKRLVAAAAIQTAAKRFGGFAANYGKQRIGGVEGEGSDWRGK